MNVTMDEANRSRATAIFTARRNRFGYTVAYSARLRISCDATPIRWNRRTVSLGRRDADLSARLHIRPAALRAEHPASMPFRRRAQIDRLDDERERDHQRANHRKRPEHVDIGHEIDLLLQGLSHPGDRL